MILYFAFWLINILCIIRRKNNNVISFLSYVYFGLMFVSNQAKDGDAQLYKLYFENQWFSGGMFEPGYTFVEKCLHMIGIHTYTGLLISLFVIATFFLWIGLRKLDASYHYLFVIAMPFIIPTYATAIRFFVASAIMMAAIRCLAENKRLFFVALVVCAGSFHLLSMSYLAFLLCTTKRMTRISGNRKFILWFVGIFSLLSFAISVVSKSNPLVMAIVRVAALLFNIGENKLDAYATTNTNLGGLIFLFIYLSGLAIAMIMRKKVYAENSYRFDASDLLSENGGMLLTYCNINYNINLLLSVFLPFVAMNLIFYRLLIIGHLTNALVLGLYLNQHKLQGTLKVYSVAVDFREALLIVACACWFVPEVIGINSITIKGMIEASGIF